MRECDILKFLSDLIEKLEANNKAKQILVIRAESVETLLLNIIGAVNIINRQQAEIEKLQMMIDSDNEVCTECHCEYMDKVHQARIEAIKEFARRLKAKAKDEFMYGYKMLTMATEFVVVKEIDNLVKEMVGDTE